MRLYTILWVAVAAAFGLTLVLDMTPQKTVSKDKIVIAFASMWAPGEPMMKGYEQLFRRFEQEHPGYEVEPRWDGRWVLSALRPRLLTGTNIPDIVNTDRDALLVLVKTGYAAALDDVIDRIAYPHDRGEQPASDKRLRDAFLPKILKRCYYTRRATVILRDSISCPPGSGRALSSSTASTTSNSVCKYPPHGRIFSPTAG